MKKSILYFTRAERIGLLAISALSLLLYGSRSWQDTVRAQTTFEWEICRVDSLRDSSRTTRATSDSLALTAFNPNDVEAEQLIAMGLPRRLSYTWSNYVAKGGYFRKAEDLMRIYGMEEALFEQLRPYLRFGGRGSEERQRRDTFYRSSSTHRSASTDSIRLDINQASAEQWRRLYGIGPVLSSRIVKFRDKLGGFHTVDQVADTYGLADSTFQQIRPHLYYGQAHQRFRIDTASVKSLGRHPYLNWGQARAIINFRSHRSGKLTESDFWILRVLDKEQKQQLHPYLLFSADSTQYSGSPVPD